LRIVAGRWRGRTLTAPPKDATRQDATRPGATRQDVTRPDVTRPDATRPTADRVRQALFDMLVHAPWGGPETIRDATVLDVFAGTGAMGLEALSRGARHATFIENAPAALVALRANIRACQAADISTVIPADALKLRPSTAPPASLVFLDPPYRQGLIPLALAALRVAGLIAPDALMVAETGRDEPPPHPDCLAERTHGAARVTIWRETGG